MGRGLVVLVLAITSGRVASAGECANGCWLDPGQLCVGSAAGRGFARLAEPGQPVRLVVERHLGSCGALTPVDPARLQASVADAPNGPFAPLTMTHDERHLEWQPPHAGDFYLRIVEGQQPGDGVALVRLATQPLAETRLLVVPPPGARKGWVEIRALPEHPIAALQAGFGEQRWPAAYAGDAVLRTPTPVRLAPGRYLLRWSSDNGTALLPFAAHGERELRLELPRASLRVTGQAPADGWLLLTMDADAGVSERACFDGRAPKVDERRFLPAGKVHLQWFHGAGACPMHRPKETPAFEETVTLTPAATVRASWPPPRATSSANRR